ncbi:hypothetical protein UFOVP1095_6 [uncultured Caudovirales phage]|uniref:Uncharacterized protein n=1 Tax=uncultured Caudovirales phage TaxID=2100421 RepID=A0A6J5PIQ1_9CAUD|nr:hypothetical protein UFOVP918_6 [uncultured Caudovirales phage]CAB4182356.1 hypothetical protein UFOVP1095_6 [uncultured Caudovirales phage]CAB4213846.1 hypothetical protein UFOVP1452_6 [uncultured Caudovirales phage]CAB5228397.1 hypothetical protein UFOVP1540_35 [uncultured Caudovirales phage]
MIHIIIRQENRTPKQGPLGENRSRLALPINADLHTPNGKTVNGMPQFDVTPQPPQLHTQGAEIKDWTNIEYAAEWDGVSPWITILAGYNSSLKMRYMGWPTCTKEEWDALNPIQKML